MATISEDPSNQGKFIAERLVARSRAQLIFVFESEILLAKKILNKIIFKLLCIFKKNQFLSCMNEK